MYRTEDNRDPGLVEGLWELLVDGVVAGRGAFCPGDATHVLPRIIVREFLVEVWTPGLGRQVWSSSLSFQ